MGNDVKFNSFKQDLRQIRNQNFDTTRALSYEQAYAHIKTQLQPVMTKEVEDWAEKRRAGVIVNMNKAFLRERLARFHKLMEAVIATDELRLENLSPQQFLKLATSEMAGYDILDDAFADPGVSDIYVYNWSRIYVEKNGVNQLYPRRFRNEKHFADFVERISREADTKVDKGSNKISDFDLYEDRYCGISERVAAAGLTLTIRKHSETHISLNDILKSGCLDMRTAEFFRLILRGQCNLIYAGITGSGKTTTLRALLDHYIAETGQRILTCEDTRELFLENAQTLELTTVKDFDPNKAVDLSRLVKTALRLKPKYVIIGEVRGEEAEAAVEAAATGHSTSFTMHADEPIDAINRLVINYQKAMPRLGTDIVERIVATAMNFVCIQKNIPGIGRRIVSITEIGYDFDHARLRFVPIMEFDYRTKRFVFMNSFSNRIVNRMLGTGLTFDEIDAWKESVGVCKPKAS